jgi:hypothetical protein
LKHYWIRNINHHIYFTIGNHWSQQNFNSQTWQQLSSGAVNSFQNQGFNNDLQLQLNDAFGGVQYKLRYWKSIFKFGLFSHYISWNFKNDRNLFDKDFYIAPEFDFEKKMGYTRKLNFKYRLKNTLFPVLKYENYYLTGYNKVFKGNMQIRKELAHHFSLSFRDFSIANDYQYYINLSYQQKINPVSSRIVYQNIQSYTMPAILQSPAQLWHSNLFAKYDLKKLYVKMLYRFQYNIRQQYIQAVLTDSKFLSHQYQLGLGSYFQNYPNFDAGSKFTWNNYRLNALENKSKSIIPYFEITYDFAKAVNFKLTYQLHIDYDFESKENMYQDAGFSLLYQKENKAWGFELSGANLFNNTVIYQNIQSNIVASSSRIFVQGRTIFFKIKYKL